MIDFPQTVSIEYNNLSNSSLSAERQKDLLVQVLNASYGNKKIFKENLSSEKIDSDNKIEENGFIVKCVQCFDTEMSKLLISSIKKREKFKNDDFITFKVTSFDKIYEWKIDISKKKYVLIHSGKTVKILFRSIPGIQIKSSGKALANASLGDTISIEVTDWFNKNTTLAKHNIVRALVVGRDEVEYGIK